MTLSLHKAYSQLSFSLFFLLLSNPFPSHASDIQKGRAVESMKLVAQLSGLNVHKMYVADFSSPAADVTPQGVFFAATFSRQFSKNIKGIEVLSRVEAHAYLQKSNWTDNDLAKPDVLAQFTWQFQCDALLRGNISWSDQNYTIEFIAQDATGKALFRDQYEEPRESANDGYLPVPGSPARPPFYFAGLDGVTMPKATYMPNPSYTDHARHKKINGTMLISAVVTAQGRLSDMRVLQSLDPELDENSLRTLATWRVTPASGPDGTPLPVRVPFELTFRLY